MILSLMGLSEESQVAYLQKKIRESEKKDMRAFSTAIWGLFLGILGFCFMIGGVVNNGNAPSGMNASWNGMIILGFLMVAPGAFLFVTGLIVSKYYSGKAKGYERELDKLANTTLICPNCQKTLPEGNAQFCVYCGKSLSEVDIAGRLQKLKAQFNSGAISMDDYEKSKKEILSQL
jgi:hypothetical protein